MLIPLASGISHQVLSESSTHLTDQKAAPRRTPQYALRGPTLHDTMDSIFASADFSSQSPAATRRLSASSAAPLKLRDSCDACAASKVKCHKEKPVCSRCAKRNIPCKYVATKRAGRKHENRLSGTSSGAPSLNAQVTASHALAGSNWPITPSTASGSDYFTSSNTIEASLGLDACGSSSEAFSSLLSPVDASIFSTLHDLDTDFDSFFASPLPLPIPETGTENADPDLLGESRFFSGGNTPNSASAAKPVRIDDTLTVLEEAVGELPSFFNHRSPSSDGRLSGVDRPPSQGSSVPPHSCCCLMRALELLRKLFPAPSASCRIAKKDAFDNRNQNPTVQAVIAENESTISALNDMLECPCSEDGYLLAIISLVVFKVMGWYAAAAGRAPANEDDGEVSVPTGRSSRSSSVHREQVRTSRYTYAVAFWRPEKPLVRAFNRPHLLTCIGTLAGPSTARSGGQLPPRW